MDEKTERGNQLGEVIKHRPVVVSNDEILRTLDNLRGVGFHGTEALIRHLRDERFAMVDTMCDVTADLRLPRELAEEVEWVFGPHMPGPVEEEPGSDDTRARRAMHSDENSIQVLSRAVTGVELDVMRERDRQLEKGFSAAHDDLYTDGELPAAAALYAFHAGSDNLHRVGRGLAEHGHKPYAWPQKWAAETWRPENRRADLVNAAALIVAEIERLDRAEALAETVEADRRAAERGEPSKFGRSVPDGDSSDSLARAEAAEADREAARYERANVADPGSASGAGVRDMTGDEPGPGHSPVRGDAGGSMEPSAPVPPEDGARLVPRTVPEHKPAERAPESGEADAPAGEDPKPSSI